MGIDISTTRLGIFTHDDLSLTMSDGSTILGSPSIDDYHYYRQILAILLLGASWIDLSTGKHNGGLWENNVDDPEHDPKVCSPFLI